MLHHLGLARFRRALSRHARGDTLRLDELRRLADAAGVSFLQASLLLDADPDWQRLFLDEDGFATTACATRDDCSVCTPCEVVWRPLGRASRPVAA